MSSTGGTYRAERGSTRPGAPTAEREWLTLTEVQDYASVDANAVERALARGALRPVVHDPRTPGGTLLARRAIDAWWRDRALSRVT